MHEPAAATADHPVMVFARMSGAVDALSSAIAGFALLAGTRAFAFTALLAWREPVLGGAGLVLLAVIGWLRWRCGGRAAAGVIQKMKSRSAVKHGNGSCGIGTARVASVPPPAADGRNVACYNRPSECGSTRCIAAVERQPLRPYSNAGVNRPRQERSALPGSSVHARAASRQSDYKETPC